MSFLQDNACPHVALHTMDTIVHWRDSLPIDMLLSAVSVLVVAQSSSEIPEGLMNNSVFSVNLVLENFMKKKKNCPTISLPIYIDLNITLREDGRSFLRAFASSCADHVMVCTVCNKYRHCTYNLTLRRVGVTIVAVGKQ